MMNGTDQVKVLLGESIVAILSLANDGTPARLSYSQEWKKIGFALSPALPLNGDFDCRSVAAFFENMLPEGNALENLSRIYSISKSNVFALALRLGNDLPGAIRLVSDSDRQEQKNTFRPIQTNELLLRLQEPEKVPMDVWDAKPRLSLAGFQKKINVLKTESGWALVDGSSLASDTILKFQRSTQPNLLLNEYLTTQIAQAAGFSVCQMHFVRLQGYPILEIKRFDRRTQKDDKGNFHTRRRHVIDACQALGLTSDMKYEHPLGYSKDVVHLRNGVSFKKLFGLAREASNNLEFTVNILDWMLFNVFVGNCDAHGKNISFFAGPSGLTVAPWYDLIGVELIDDVEHHLAMTVGDTFVAKEIHALQLLYAVREVRLEDSLLVDRLSNLLRALKGINLKNLQPEELTVEELRFVERYQEFINERVNYWQGVFMNLCENNT